MIDLGQIVIVRGQPKDRDELRRDRFAAQTLGELDRGQGLVDRIERPGKKPDLLSGDDGAGPLPV